MSNPGEWRWAESVHGDVLLAHMPGTGGFRSLSVYRSEPGEDGNLIVQPDARGWAWNGSRERPTLYPSLRPLDIHGNELWHGWLVDGEFVPTSTEG